MKLLILCVMLFITFDLLKCEPANSSSDKEGKTDGKDDKKPEGGSPKDDKKPEEGSSKDDKKPEEENSKDDKKSEEGNSKDDKKPEDKTAGNVTKDGADPTTGKNEDSMSLDLTKNGTEENDNGSGSGITEPTTQKEIDEEEAAEENPALFEGDIKIPKDEVENFKKGSFFRRDAVTSVARLWPKGRVPYVFGKGFDASRKDTLKKAIAEYNKKTCIRVVPKTRNDKDFITFFVDRGCYSTGIGKRPRGGEQKISIGKGCNWVGTMIHEIMHAIGFFHEQSRLDRDQFINIYWQNIKRGMESQFWNYAHGEADYLGEPYDFDSVMHYHRTAFSFNGENPTIVAKDKPWRTLGQRKTLSDVDVKQVNKLYKCQIKDKKTGNAGNGGNNGRGRGGRGNGRRGRGRGRAPNNVVKILKFIKK